MFQIILVEEAEIEMVILLTVTSIGSEHPLQVNCFCFEVVDGTTVAGTVPVGVAVTVGVMPVGAVPVVEEGFPLDTWNGLDESRNAK